jgi:hypothetical protein
MRNVNLLGALGDFGVGMSPTVGAVIAAGAGTGAAVATRLLTAPGSKAYAWSEAIGLFAGLGAAGAMAAMPGTREAGKLGLAVVAVTQGLRVAESFLTGRAGGVGWAMQETANPLLGMPSAQQIAGVGYAMATQQPHAYGTVPGVAGATAGPMMDTGSPPTGGVAMSRLYGATLY